MSKKVLATVNSEKMYLNYYKQYHEMIPKFAPYNLPRVFNQHAEFTQIFVDSLSGRVIHKKYLNIILEK